MQEFIVIHPLVIIYLLVEEIEGRKTLNGTTLDVLSNKTIQGTSIGTRVTEPLRGAKNSKISRFCFPIIMGEGKYSTVQYES